MASENRASKADATSEFEHELTNLIMRSFGRGAAIEDVWDISSPVSGAPAWTVTVERYETNDESSYEPEFIED